MATTQDPTFTPLQKNIISVLKESGPITRGKMVDKLNRARSTLHDAIVKLEPQGLVKRFPKHDSKKRGRPIVLFSLTEQE